MAAKYPSSKADIDDLYLAVNNKSTNLTAGINDSTLTIPVTSTTGFPATGFISINNEIIHYTSIGATQFNADLRGADGSTAAAHSNNDQVAHHIVAAHHNASTDELIAVEDDLVNALAALNDSTSPAATATNLKNRIDQIVTAIKQLGNAGAWTDTLFPGKVLQVVQGTSTTSFSTTSTSFVATNLSVSITPKFSTSKIFIIATSTMQNTETANTISYATLTRGGTNLGPSEGLARMNSDLVGLNMAVPTSIHYLDSPATTSPTTYDVRVKIAGSSNAVIWGLTATQGQVITAVEVAA